MRCRDRCGDCCGPAPVTGPELTRLRAFIRQHDLQPHQHAAAPGRCPAFDGARCTVYPVRPMICRLFARVADLPCPHGCGDAAVPVQQARALVRRARPVGFVADAWR